MEKKCNVERYFATVHKHFEREFPGGNSLWSQKVSEIKSALQRQQSLFTKPSKRVNTATEASFKVAHYLTKNKETFIDGVIVKGAMSLMAESLFRDFQNNAELVSAISDVELGANIMARRVYLHY